MKRDHKIRVGITQGDINGIGYEVILKTLSDNRIDEICTPIVYGSPKVAAYHRKALELENFNLNQIRSASEADPKRPNIINCCDENVRVELGKSTQEAGFAAFQALECAVADLKNGTIDVLVTAPINKENIQSESFNFPGHTEYLAKAFDARDHVMMLMNDDFKVGLVVAHAPISEVAGLITEKLILKKLRILNKSMIADFACSKPRIAVLALNPHAGDNGLLGDEEIRIISPAIKKANDEGMIVLGPYPADGFFGSGLQYKFDVVLAMYHDQGLAPFKALTFDRGINYSAGLPIVRTSPDHGTAYDIAGENKASEVSFREALYSAIDIFHNRERYAIASQNPLQKYEINNNGEIDDVTIIAPDIADDQF